MCPPLTVLLLNALIVGNLCAKLPSYIKPCSLTDPKRTDCFVKQANEAIPIFTKGDKSFKIPSMRPIVLPEVVLEAGNNLKIVNRDVTADLKDVIATDVNFDFGKKRITQSGKTPKLEILTKYDISGQISILPVSGQGDFNVTFIDLVYTYTADFETEKKHGEEYIKLGKSTFDYTTKRAYFYFGNLFNGDPRLGPEVNKFVDENWTDFNKELAPALQGAMQSVIEIALKGYLERIPIKDLFLP